MKKTYLFTLKAEETEFNTVKVISSSDVVKYARNFFFDDIVIFESFFIIMLNREDSIIGYSKISQGGVFGTVVDVKIICKYAIESLCSSVILCHNHPSGNLNPSTQDRDMTKKIKNALNLFDIDVLDHIILTKESYTSFADENLL